MEKELTKFQQNLIDRICCVADELKELATNIANVPEKTSNLLIHIDLGANDCPIPTITIETVSFCDKYYQEHIKQPIKKERES